MCFYVCVVVIFRACFLDGMESLHSDNVTINSAHNPDDQLVPNKIGENMRGTRIIVVEVRNEGVSHNGSAINPSITHTFMNNSSSDTTSQNTPITTALHLDSSSENVVVDEFIFRRRAGDKSKVAGHSSIAFDRLVRVNDNETSLLPLSSSASAPDLAESSDPAFVNCSINAVYDGRMLMVVDRLSPGQISMIMCAVVFVLLISVVASLTLVFRRQLSQLFKRRSILCESAVLDDTRLSYINTSTDFTTSESVDDLENLDNDSFLNSLELVAPSSSLSVEFWNTGGMVCGPLSPNHIHRRNDENP